MGMDHKTPGLMAFDSRSLAVLSVNYCRSSERGPAQRRIERSLFDTAGRLVKQWDPRLWSLQRDDASAPASLTTVYSLTDAVLCTVSVDAGRQIDLRGLASEGVRSWDDRGMQREVVYDDSLRPLAVFEQGVGQPRRCSERMKYGYPGQGNREHNQHGQLIRHDDPAGTVLLESFSLVGQSLCQNRRFTRDAAAPDWPVLEADRESLLEPGDGALSTWRLGPLGDVLEQADARGNRQKRTLTLDGRLRESHLQLNDQDGWQPLVTDIRYNADGQIAQETAGNGVQTLLEYSPDDGRLMERHARRADQVLQDLFYTYDPMGNVLSIEDKALPVRYFANQRINPISRFIYDTLYQLLESTGWEAGAASQGPDSVGRLDPAAVSNYRQTYRYDESGNLLELIHVGAQNHGRQLQAARYSNRCKPYRNGVPPTEDEICAAFDARGNGLELDEGRFLAWDLRNQLSSVTSIERVSGLNDSEVYVYDGNGQRVRKRRTFQTAARALNAEVRYLPGLELRTDSGTGESLQVIAALGGLNSVRILHWESAPPSGANDLYRYSFTDHLGSNSLELAQDGRIISREHFYPFGETAYLAGEDVIEVSYKTVRYSGKERDATGLYYYGYRYYMPGLQRWLNPDPAGDIDGLNLYAMVSNNPLTFRDADGLNKTGKYEIEVGLKNRLKLTAAALTSRVGVFKEATGKYSDVNDFKVVEVGAFNDYLVGGDEVKQNLQRYKQRYKALSRDTSSPKVVGQPSNYGLGASISSYMLRSANDVFVDEPIDPDALNRHPDFVVERRFFAVMKKTDKLKPPEERHIYGLAELNAFTTKGKTEVDVVQVVVHPETQGDGALKKEALAQASSVARLPMLKGVGTFLTVHAIKAISKGADIRKIRTDAVNPRSARIAEKFDAKRVVNQ
ncbi:RHS repeat domain-containing protein [Pseudomonas fluorescens]|uniref:RHS repeat protein n=1 Tax=Pseudomonas fluorescens TaxID=294 RepID=A0A944HL78_PSEFL|nr:RHS repeat-associated core domain-containing protein [Pseudomonas fluorescens]MBT2311626.1 RHS repeat protein [Pseudomonas fluorescens]MBT2316577.1 RHS repeat protein [Pseudomonas fluorescens]MBT2331588.1 RHS repeat protein [Pseudomonas fluorescens]MBT2344396.1 RHS repeat protein [Pseudomonas fluorescens]MBT2348214.1 RHS repeat protein [Pseudomonas fluorescens]